MIRNLLIALNGALYKVITWARSVKNPVPFSGAETRFCFHSLLKCSLNRTGELIGLGRPPPFRSPVYLKDYCEDKQRQGGNYVCSSEEC